ncbi:MAG TPA: hypothetical protein VM580_13235 [Labilithrix sp.]|nr:hypothetical protein [Labilithrix sp.]
MSSSTRRALSSMVLAAALLASCNVISGLDADYTLATDGPRGEAGVVTHGGTDDADIPGIDGGGAHADANVPFRCPHPLPSNLLFCDDFEGNVNWTRSELIPGSSMLAVDNGGHGGTKGLRAHANGASTSRKVVRWKTVDTAFPPSSKITLSFRFKITAADLGYFVVGAIQVDKQSVYSNLEYGLAAYSSCPLSSPCLDQNNPTPEGSHSFAGAAAYEVGKWYRAEITVKRGAAGAYTSELRVEGESLPSTLVDENHTYFSGSPTVVEVGVGVFYSGDDNGLEGEVIIDDVIVTR